MSMLLKFQFPDLILQSLYLRAFKWHSGNPNIRWYICWSFYVSLNVKTT